MKNHIWAGVIMILILSPGLILGMNGDWLTAKINWKRDMPLVYDPYERNETHLIYDPYRDVMYSVSRNSLGIINTSTGEIETSYTFTDEEDNPIEILEFYCFESGTYAILLYPWVKVTLARIENGNIIWEFDYHGSYEMLVAEWRYYYSEHVVEADGRVYFAPPTYYTYVACLYAENGTLIWEKDLRNFTMPLYRVMKMRFYSGRLYIGGYDVAYISTLVLNAETGEIVSYIENFIMYDVYESGMIGFFGVEERIIFCDLGIMDLQGNVLWRWKMDDVYSPGIGFLKVYRGTIYVVGDDRLYAVDTSGNLKWKFIDPFAGGHVRLHRPMFDRDGNIYLGYQTVDLTLLSRYFQDALRGGVRPYIYCLNESGEVLWKIQPVISWSQALFMGFIEAIDGEGNIYLRGISYVANDDPESPDRYIPNEYCHVSIKMVRYMFAPYVVILADVVVASALIVHLRRVQGRGVPARRMRVQRDL